MAPIVVQLFVQRRQSLPVATAALRERVQLRWRQPHDPTVFRRPLSVVACGLATLFTTPGPVLRQFEVVLLCRSDQAREIGENGRN